MISLISASLENKSLQNNLASGFNWNYPDTLGSKVSYRVLAINNRLAATPRGCAVLAFEPSTQSTLRMTSSDKKVVFLIPYHIILGFVLHRDSLVDSHLPQH